MAENRALSQWEIDALLNQIPSTNAFGKDEFATAAPAARGGRASANAIKTYDFRRPDKFSKEQWTTLHSMHETFARLVGSSFSSRLRTLVTIRLSSIDQGLYEEWQAQVPAQTACYVLSMKPLSGNLVVEFNHDVASEVIDRLLGGTGVLIDRGRDMSEVELGLLRSFATSIKQALEEMWSASVRVSPELQDLGMDANLIQVAGPTDVVLTAFFEVNVGNHLGAMSLCIPYTVIEPIASQLSAQIWFQSGRRAAATDEERRLMQSLIGRSALDVGVELGGVDLPVNTIAEMREGDTLVLDTRLGRSLDIRIGDRARFRGVPGMLGTRLAVQVTEVVEPDVLPETAPISMLDRAQPAPVAVPEMAPAAVGPGPIEDQPPAQAE
ncbi:MAG: flagellar motor switch protein FliM [Dehalococcoidia bacterium]|nr:flagellar motor switch protein FliM [Dehalococcoidia bacterium]